MLRSQLIVVLSLMAIGSILRAETDYILVEDRGDRACEETIVFLQKAGVDLSAAEMLEILAQKSCHQKITQKIIIRNVTDAQSDKVVPVVSDVSKLAGLSLASEKLSLWGAGLAELPMALLKPSGAGGIRLRIQQIVSIPDSEIPLQKKPPLGLLIEIPINL